MDTDQKRCFACSFERTCDRGPKFGFRCVGKEGFVLEEGEGRRELVMRVYCRDVGGGSELLEGRGGEGMSYED